MMEYFYQKYYTETQSYVKRIDKNLTSKNIASIVCKYLNDGLSVERKELITRFLFAKRKTLIDLYNQKEV
jgi:hypothetical protein